MKRRFLQVSKREWLPFLVYVKSLSDILGYYIIIS